MRNQPDVFSGTLAWRANAIDGLSYGDAAGVHAIQQNGGSANRVLAAQVVQADIAGADAVGTAASVRGRSSENDVTRETGEANSDIAPISDVARSNAIRGAAFSGQSGVATVQQNSGDANDIGAATAVHTAADGIGDLTQSAATDGRVDDNAAGDGPLTDPGLTLVNEIDAGAEDATGPFDGVAGVVTVQQNNGVANTLGVANAVAGVVGATGAVTQTVGSQNDPRSGVEDQSVLDEGAFDEGALDEDALNSGTLDRRTLDQGSERANAVVDAFNGATSGIATVQQNNGDANVIGASNAVLGLLTADEATTGSGDVTQTAVAGTGVLVDTVDAQAITPRRNNVIDGSFSGGTGVFAVQQNSGDANALALANAVVAVGDDGFGNLNQEVAAGGDIVNVDTYFLDGRHANTIEGDSFDGATGWITVQQNAGNANILAAATALAAATGPLEGVTADQTVSAGGDIGTFQIFDDSSGFTIAEPQPRRDNVIENAFDRAAGVATVQQNSGDANVLAAALALVTSTGPGSPSSATQTVSADGTIASAANTAEDVIDFGSNRNQ